MSHEALKYADQNVIIPQAPGFVDSFNVSVATALALYEARTSRIRCNAPSPPPPPPTTTTPTHPHLGTPSLSSYETGKSTRNKYSCVKRLNLWSVRDLN